jgi:hypothetical protein
MLPPTALGSLVVCIEAFNTTGHTDDPPKIYIGQ